MAEEARFMVQLWLDGARLLELGRALDLAGGAQDPAYLVHCALGELFGEVSPGPFSVESCEGRMYRILAYSAVDAARLKGVAEATASPLAWVACDWPTLESKPMPQLFSAGTRLGFTVRVCPVIRTRSPDARRGAHREVDAYLARMRAAEPQAPASREQAYAAWLGDVFARHGAAHLEEVHMAEFSLERLLRRTQPKVAPRSPAGRASRVAHAITRPCASLAGILVVADPERFSRLLARGVGRHTAFGFGMLKLSRPTR